MKGNYSGVLRSSVGGFVVAAFLCAGVQSARAAVLALYEFTGNSLASTDANLNSVAGAFANGSGITAGFSTSGNPSPSRYSLGSTTGTTLNANDYFSFTVTANAGYRLNLSGSTMTFDAQRNGGTSGNYALRSSLDNFAANLATSALTASFVNYSYTMSGAQWDNLSSIEYRIYMWDNGATSLRFDNVTLNGAVVPEPVHYALGIFGLVFVGIRAGRHCLARRRVA